MSGVSITPIRFLAWKGYKAILASFEQELKELGLKVHVRELDDADLIYAGFINNLDYYDAVVVDWEYRKYYEDAVLPLNFADVQIKKYLAPFSKRFYAEVGEKLCFVPL